MLARVSLLVSRATDAAVLGGRGHANALHVLHSLAPRTEPFYDVRVVAVEQHGGEFAEFGACAGVDRSIDGSCFHFLHTLLCAQRKCVYSGTSLS